MIPKWPDSVPDRHRTFLSSTIDQLQRDIRIVGIAAGGSFLADSMDEFSDLDLVIAVEPNRYESVMDERRHIAGSLGQLLVAFTGEHVGEPRLLICLYDGVSLLHVDFKFVALPDAAKRIEDPFVLWERDGRFTRALREGIAEYPAPGFQWIEDRFWVWIHYATTKVGRGELFEALDALSFIRVTVLGPLVLRKAGARPSGVRRIEGFAPEDSHHLEATLAGHHALECLGALRACADFYRTLRANTAGIECRDAAEQAAMRYLLEMEQRCGSIRSR